MESGSSFLVPPESVDAVRVAAYSYGRRHGQTFSVRSGPDGVARCWRTDGTDAREAGGSIAAGRRIVRAVSSKPVRVVDDVRVFADQHGVEFVPLDDLLNATLKTGNARLALDKLPQVAEIHPNGAQRAHYAALLGQIDGALIGDGAESIAKALAPITAPFDYPDDSEDPV
jgi:hypothetical protein